MRATILQGDCRSVLPTLPAESVHCVVTSPPYLGLRDYGHPDQLGLEATPQDYVAALVEVFRQVRRVLHPDGVVWLNLGDSYAGGGCGSRDPWLWPKQSRNDHMPVHGKTRTGLKDKDLVGIPWRTALALQDDGWWLRRDVIWYKPNAMPESVTDRPSSSHEYVFLLTKSADYFYDADAIKEEATYAETRNGRIGAYQRRAMMQTGDGTSPTGSADRDTSKRNKRSVWCVNTAQYKGAHFATFPPELITPMILAGSSERGCCPGCLAPWDRITKKGEPDREWQRRCGGNADGEYHGQGTKDYQRAGVQNPSSVKARILAGMRERRTVGWRKTCQCPRHDPVPCTILDPFAGSGTVGEVATKLNRQAVLIELNPDYVGQAERRNAQCGLGL